MKTSFRRIVAGTAALAAGAMIIGTVAPAEAGTTVTNYAFKAWSFGTLVDTDQVGVTSGPTAYSWMGCTRLTGLEHKRSVATVEPPSGLVLGAVDTTTKTFRNHNTSDSTPDTDAGVRTTNRVADVIIGDPAGVHLEIKGLASTGYAWADKKGNLHAKAVFNSTDINAVLPDQLAPLQDVLNQVDFGLKDLIKTILAQPGNQIELPGLAMIRVGKTVISQKPGAKFAWANVHALRVRLYGPNGVNDQNTPGQGDDAQVVIGRSHARIYKNATDAVMGGNAYGLDATALNNIAHVGPLVERSLQCLGTGGTVKSASTAAVDPGQAGQLVLNGVSASACGSMPKDAKFCGKKAGPTVAWTEGKVAGLNLGDGQLVITGVVGHAQVLMTKGGNFYKSIKGSTVGSITSGGQTQAIPDPGQSLEIPNVAKIETNVVTKRNNFIQVIAVRVTLLDGSGAVINLGKASAWVKPF